MVRKDSSSDGEMAGVQPVTNPGRKRGPKRKKPRLMGPALPPPSVNSEESALDTRDDKGMV